MIFVFLLWEIIITIITTAAATIFIINSLKFIIFAMAILTILLKNLLNFQIIFHFNFIVEFFQYFINFCFKVNFYYLYLLH